MKTYRHIDIPELEAQIQNEWHKDYRDDNFVLMHNRTVVLMRVKDSEIEGNPFWELIYDTEQGGELNPPQSSKKKTVNVFGREIKITKENR